MFKGEAGARLKREIVRRSQTANLMGEEIEQVRTRPTEEQKKIRELISSAKTLADVERVNQILQASNLNQNGQNGTNDVNMNDEDD
ncbi:hypothetical protein Mgra_00004453 [Meloidogyne graminicola]|uniref:Programmed cell death protein 5 n=1 Tax=Meloidogyne graminicola TaxID=189291 RepID=A0A8S9ZSM6_9BILA|nr:hypothetical protein Mgra_00004453 [Meloidogyne graminicola]